MSRIVTLWLPNFITASKMTAMDDAIAQPEQVDEPVVVFPGMPALSTLLSKADVFSDSSTCFYQQASSLCHLGNTFPIAATTAISDLESPDLNQFWLRLDPVQMIPDRDTLVLFTAEELAITDEESRSLIDVFNAHFKQDDVQLEKGAADRWYLSIKQPIDVVTTPLMQASRRSVDQTMPTGNAAAYLRTLVNEAQMLFYTADVNEKRREQGMPEINSVWVWGEGTLTQEQCGLSESGHWSVKGDHPYLSGLSTLMGARYGALPDSYDDWLKTNVAERNLLVEDRLRSTTLPEWIKALAYYEKHWFAPLLAALKNKEIESLLIDLGSGKRFHLTPSHLKKFWRWNKVIKLLV